MPADNLRGRSGSGDGRTSTESNCRLLGLDLLFYHLRLRCFVVIDLKIEEFKPEFAGQNELLSFGDRRTNAIPE
jgi:hypothetical protein